MLEAAETMAHQDHEPRGTLGEALGARLACGYNTERQESYKPRCCIGGTVGEGER